MVTSRLDYCKTLLNRFQNVQLTAARLIANKRKYDPVTNDLIDFHLHWLPVKERINFKILVFTFKSLHQQAPEYISNMLQLVTGRRRLCSTSSAPQFTEPRTHCVILADRSCLFNLRTANMESATATHQECQHHHRLHRDFSNVIFSILLMNSSLFDFFCAKRL